MKEYWFNGQRLIATQAGRCKGGSGGFGSLVN